MSRSPRYPKLSESAFKEVLDDERRFVTTTLERLPERPYHKECDLKWEQSIQASRLFAELLGNLEVERKEVSEMLFKTRTQTQFDLAWNWDIERVNPIDDLEARLELNSACRKIVWQDLREFAKIWEQKVGLSELPNIMVKPSEPLKKTQFPTSLVLLVLVLGLLVLRLWSLERE